eukprot:SAG11_NODE_24466_length_373_cov_0.518248_2_plen_28_part_01
MRLYTGKYTFSVRIYFGGGRTLPAGINT